MKIAIAEDDAKQAKQLIEYIERFSKETNIPIESILFDNGAKLVVDYKPIYDFILLDVDMPVANGIETAMSIREIDPFVFLMFFTNLAQYAYEGFEVEPLDYVLKPVSYPAFAMKIARSCSSCAAKATSRS